MVIAHCRWQYGEAERNYAVQIGRFRVLVLQVGEREQAARGVVGQFVFFDQLKQCRVRFHDVPYQKNSEKTPCQVVGAFAIVRLPLKRGRLKQGTQ